MLYAIERIGSVTRADTTGQYNKGRKSVDKYEYQVCADQIKNFIAEKKYAEAMEIADKIDWRRVKSVSMLCTVSEIYKVNKRYEESRDILLLAYDRYPKGRMIVYALCELALKMKDIVQAVEYYKEFVRVAPGDTGSYILLYKIYEAQDVSIDERIKVLEEFKKRDYRERWAYELAFLYHKTGQETKCVSECDELILWFGEGKYVKKAMELKMQHAHLSADQQQKYNAAPHASYPLGQQAQAETKSAAPQTGNYSAPMGAYTAQAGAYGAQAGAYNMTQPQNPYAPDQNSYGGYAPQEPYSVSQDGMGSTPVASDADRYSTQNLQAELERDMEQYLNASNTGEVPMGLGTGELNIIDTGRLNTGGLDVINTGQIQTGELDVINTGQIQTGELDVINTGQIHTGELDVINTGQVALEGAGYGMEGMSVSQVESGVPEKTQEFVFDANANYMQQFVQTYIAPQAPQYTGEQEPQVSEDAGQEPAMSFKELAGVVTEELGAALSMDSPEEAIEGEAVEIETEAAEEEAAAVEETEPEESTTEEEAADAEATEGPEPEEEAEAEIEEPEAAEEDEPAAEEAAETEEPEAAGAEESEAEEEPAGTEEPEVEEEAVGTEEPTAEEETAEAETTEESEIEEAAAAESDAPAAEEEVTEAEEAETEAAEPEEEAVEAEATEEPETEEAEAEETEESPAEEKTAEPEESETEESPAEEAKPEEPEEVSYETPEEEIKQRVENLQKKYDYMLGQESDGQLHLSLPDTDMVERQITGQIDIEEILRNRRKRFENTEDMESKLSGVIADWSSTETQSTEEAELVNVPEDSAIIDINAVAAIMKEEEERAREAEPTEEEETEAGAEEEAGTEEAEEPAAEEQEPERVYPPMFSYELEDYGEVEEIEDIEQPDEVDEIIKTSNLPIEEIAEYNALAEQALNAEREPEPLPSNYDENGRMKHPSYMVLEEARKSRRDFDDYEFKLFGRYDGIENVKAQLVDVIDDMSMQADTGNIVVTGDEVSCRKTMAIDLVKAMQQMDSSFMGKVAKISGEALNKKNIPSTLRKLNNGALIVENAEGLSAAALTIIAQSLSNEVESVLIVLEGESEPIQRLLETNPQMFDPAFNARISIDEFTNDDLVAYARGYAREREHSIDEMGTLALYTRIGELQTLDHKVTVEDIKELIDLAIVHVDKMTVGHLIDVLVSKRYDDDDFIIIREKDFLLDGKQQEKLQKQKKKQKKKK